MKPIRTFILLAAILASSGPAQETQAPATPAASPAPAPGEAASAVPTGTPAPRPEGDAGAVPTTDGEVAVANPAVPASPPDEAATASSGQNSSAGATAKQPDLLQRSNLILAKILENIRPTDPFGMPMDPANAPVITAAASYGEGEAVTTVDSGALKEALQSLPITGVYPLRQILVLGPRTFRTGGEFGIKIDDATIRLRFDGIRGGEIFFTDMDTEEAVSIPFNAKPAEFEPIGDQQKTKTGSGISSMRDLFIAD